MARITILKADIAQLDVDAIVNSANPSLLAGSGLCGYIHKLAGRELERECVAIGSCSKGEAVITNGYNLKAEKIIHAVGPHYILDNRRAPELLEACYLSIMRLANQYELKSIAIPAISTNVYQYPVQEATMIAFKTMKRFLADENVHIEDVVFVVASDETHAVYKEMHRLYFL